MLNPSFLGVTTGSMRLRGQTLRDLAVLEKNATFPLSNVKSVLNASVVDESGKLLGTFMVSLCAEVSLILRGDIKKRDKVGILRLVEFYLLKYLKVDWIHLFVDEQFAKILKRHFGFEDAIGKAICRRLNG